MLLFVYGTLLKGMEREFVLSDSQYLGPAVFQAQLFDLGDYPGIKVGRGLVIGELYEINRVTLDLLDKLEGYKICEGNDSLYLRREVEIRRISGGSVQAFCYFYNHGIKNRNLIINGDYRRFRLEKETEDQWVLAYGSDISTGFLIKRIGEVKASKRGYIDGFRLIFQVTGKQVVYANIFYAGAGEKCPAVAYQLTLDQTATLDKWRGIPNNYLRLSIPFHAQYDHTSIVQAYIAHPEKLVTGLDVECDCIEHIQCGYEEHGFDKSYLMKVLEDANSFHVPTLEC
ncbi:MAG: gamma-glutamylcyclotransferase [Candidatus Poribacteria bacterium]|nr:gamma-glutamylcyclotransferase [Candidatus Poribacteria bacterium]